MTVFDLGGKIPWGFNDTVMYARSFWMREHETVHSRRPRCYSDSGEPGVAVISGYFGVMFA